MNGNTRNLKVNRVTCIYFSVVTDRHNNDKLWYSINWYSITTIGFMKDTGAQRKSTSIISNLTK
jgi:hypothetical protein